MEDEKKRKLTRKRCKIGERFDKKLEKCLPITVEPSGLKSILPNTILGNILNIQRPEESKQTRKRCPKGEHFNAITNKCEATKIKEPNCKKGTIRNSSGKCEPKNITRKILPTDVTTDVTTELPNDVPTDVSTDVPTDVPTKIMNEEPLIQDETIFENKFKQEEFEMEEESEIEEEKMDKDILNKENDKTLLEKEKKEYEESTISSSYDFLYPELNDQEFAYKITKHKEFNDTKYDGKIYDIKSQSELLCNSDFELMPHQIFVKNFLSFQTPYNSLLLYHGLGTGKTCSAIGISEEMRTYMRQIGISKQILVVASPNVQDNFRLQLFDERKLKETDGLWNIQACIGNALLQEINPTNLYGLTRERIILQINTIIRQSYKFMGYNEFANYITRKTSVPDDAGYSIEKQREFTIKNIKTHFNNRLIIIDEIHNLTLADNKQKRTSKLLHTIAKHTENMRLLLLSATPMYNSYSEIIWLINLININDKRATIDVSDVFKSDGNFKEGGKELLKRKLTGYVSYVRGENPYTFPYRIYPEIFAPEHSLSNNKYPEIQMNNKKIDEPLQHVPVFLNDIGSYQIHGYKFIMKYLFERSFNRTDKFGNEQEMPTFENMDTFGYTLLYGPLVALNIVYPNEVLDNMIKNSEEIEDSEEMKNIISSFVGQEGLSKIVTYKEDPAPNIVRHSYQYRPDILKKYGPIFSQNEIHKYSQKITTICDYIKKSKGIVLVYSQYIDGGAVPIALALEEMGFGRFGTASYTKNLFKTPPCEPIDARTMKSKTEFENEKSGTFKQAKYIMITGHKEFSPNNYADVNYTTNPENSNGEFVKVIIISKAAAEGLDFKHIRQVHIMEPWYNMNRIEQIIGRGVRNQSHCKLPFEERNVQIFLHTTLLDTDKESADLYVYRVAEYKAIQIGRVTRLMKEVAVDCLLNISQTNFTQEKLFELVENQNIKINLSSGEFIDFKVGDKPYTDICDYMDNCAFKCATKNPPIENEDIIKHTYTTEFMKSNSSTLLKRIRDLFRERSIYNRKQLVAEINVVKVYPKVQIYYALTYFIDNKTEELIDKYGRIGHLVNRGDFYMFQPNEITDENASIYERVAPVDYKRERLLLELPEKIGIVRMNSIDASEKINDLKEEYTSIINNIIQITNLILGPKKHLKSGEKNWYEHLNNVVDILVQNHDLTVSLISKYAITHILDCLSFYERLILLNNVFYTNDEYIPTGLEQKIKEYFDEKTIQYNGSKIGIVLANVNELEYLVYKNDEWVNAEPEDKDHIREVMRNSKVNVTEPLIGFMHPFKGNEIVFKVKHMTTTNKNNKGARIDQAAKPEIIAKINSILGKQVYDVTKKTNEKSIGLGAILEILMRYTTETGKANLFFSPENTILNNIIDL
jgi:hypothetical protein